MLSVYDSELVASLKDKALLEKKQVLNHLFSNQIKKHHNTPQFFVGELHMEPSTTTYISKVC